MRHFNGLALNMIDDDEEKNLRYTNYKPARVIKMTCWGRTGKTYEDFYYATW